MQRDRLYVYIGKESRRFPTLANTYSNDLAFRLHQGNGFGSAIVDDIMTAA